MELPKAKARGFVCLRVFWLKDGRETLYEPLFIKSVRGEGLAPKNLPTGVPKTDIGLGPFELRPNGVACYGLRYTFEDEQLKVEREQDTTEQGRDRKK